VSLRTSPKRHREGEGEVYVVHTKYIRMYSLAGHREGVSAADYSFWEVGVVGGLERPEQRRVVCT